MRACGGNSSSTNCNYDKAEIIFFHLFELDDLVVRGGEIRSEFGSGLMWVVGGGMT